MSIHARQPLLACSIVTLEAVSDSARTARDSQCNAQRVVSIREFGRSLTYGRRGRWRKVINLSLALPPRNPANGFIFGTSRDVCDVVLPTDQAISLQQFRIVHNLTTSNLMLINTSHHATLCGGILMSYGAKLALRQGLIIRCGSVAFKVNILRRSIYQKEYEGGLSRFLTFCRSLPPAQAVHPEPLLAMNGRSIVKKFVNFARLGRDSAGNDFIFVHTQTGRVFAARRIRFPNNARSALDKQVDALKPITHTNVVRLLRVVVHSPNESYLLTEYLPYGNVMQRGRLDICSIGSVLAQSLHALKYLHQRHITHGDIIPSSLLVKGLHPLHIQLEVVSIPSVASGNNDHHEHGNGPAKSNKTSAIFYRAPDLFQPHSYATPKSDIWALGVTILSLYGTVPALEGIALQKHPLDPLRAHTYHKAVVAAAKTVPGPLCPVLRAMLCLEPAARADARVAVRDAVEVVDRLRVAAATHPDRADDGGHLDVC